MEYEDRLERALAETVDVTERSDRFEIPEPEIRTEGNVTVYENFQATLDRLDRDASQVLKFLQSELGTSAGIDERGRARLTGTFKPERIAATIESYVERFVLCSECGLPDTHLVTEAGEPALKCDACGALSPLPDA